MFKLEIRHDEYAENPRHDTQGVWGDLATIAWIGGNRRIPNTSHDRVMGLREARETLKDTSKFVLRNYLDGECLLFVDKDAFCKEHGHKAWNRHLAAKALRYLAAVEEEYSAWLEGEVYGWIITNDMTGEPEESCWGFYGYESAKEAGEEALAYLVGRAPVEVGLPGKVFTHC